MNNTTTIKSGKVSFKSTSHCAVILDGEENLCRISSRLKIVESEELTNSQVKIKAREVENSVVVGDHVVVQVTENSEPIINERLPRQNQLSRSSSNRPGGQMYEQVLVSNVDQVIAVFAATNPEPKWNLLDRYLVLAEAVDLPIRIVITKMDLITSQDQRSQLLANLEPYQKMDYSIHFISSLKMEGISELMQFLANRNSVMIGKSGVGKTSLLNALIPGLNYRVSAVNTVTGKGRHTTSAMRLIQIDADSNIIDSPGTREFGFWDVDPDDLDWYFRDMRPYLGSCKFRMDCRHEDEPGCAVRQAVVKQEIDPRRYQSYLRLKEDFLR
jgi:ribosome biogenesis GTPase